MPNWVRRLFGRSRSLKDAVNDYEEIVVEGVIFRIRKICPLDYVAGSKVMLQVYDVWKVGEKLSEGQTKKMREHYTDTFMAGVIKPRLARKEKDAGEDVWVGELFQNWDMAHQLYTAIIEKGYGKKKSILSLFRGSA